MYARNKTIAILFIIIASIACAQAQTAQAAQKFLLDFVQGENLSVTTAKGVTLSYAEGGIFEGDEVSIGSIIKTGAKTTAEFRIKPNGTIVKLAAGTTFKVEKLATPSSNTNAFAIAAGKIRAVAAKGANYDIRTSNTTCGVRGTDFTMAFEEGKKALLLVKKGAVEFAKLGLDGLPAETIMVAAGRFADFFAPAFAAQPYTPEMLASEYDDLPIAQDRVDEVEGDGQGEAPAVESKGPSVATEPPPSAEAPVEGGPEAASPREESGFVKWLREMLGMEIGSITIDGETYAKAVIQPVFKVGKLKAGLYLPVIYSNNLFDPQDWYHPRGNDEWSFGTDIGWKAEPLAAFVDAATDLSLKIRFLEYGEPLVDPFFLKVGNLSTFTVGHGLIMRNYANDTEFPSVRRLGVNIGVQGSGGGFEALVNDLAEPEIFGGRFFLRPFKGFGLAFGLSAVADTAPAGMLNSVAVPDAADAWGNPVFMGLGVDADLPIVTSDIFGLRLFADAGGMLPYTRTDAVGKQGFRFDMLWDDASLKARNYGLATGLLGNVLFVDWRLEYRYFTGVFRPAFFDKGYDRSRGELVKSWAGYLDGSTPMSDSPSVMGIYGEGGASILKDKLGFTVGYFWPWSAEAGSLREQAAKSGDYFKAGLIVRKGLIPIVDVSGSISYERRNFIQTLLGKEASGVTLFDENTVFSGEIVVPVPKAPNLDLAFIVSTVVAHEKNGDVVYDAFGKPEILPVITMETRLHF